MARIRNNYDNSWWPRLQRWIKEGSTPLDDAMIAEYSDDSTPDEASKADRVQRQGAAREARIEDHLQDELRVYNRVHDWANGRGSKMARRLYMLMAVLVCTGIILVLLTTAGYLPAFGNPDNPVHNEVSRRYIEQGQEETGAVNIVAGMILDYRAFDTLGESNVLFVAACAVLILLRISSEKEGNAARQLELEADDRMFEPKNDTILQHVTALLMPLILLGVPLFDTASVIIIRLTCIPSMFRKIPIP